MTFAALFAPVVGGELHAESVGMGFLADYDEGLPHGQDDDHHGEGDREHSHFGHFFFSLPSSYLLAPGFRDHAPGVFRCSLFPRDFSSPSLDPPVAV